MTEKKEGLLGWELDFIQKIDPGIVRKRLREELDYLYSVGTIVEAIKADDLLSHMLVYAWKSTYHLALVCKRFWIITKSRAYWRMLAKHALKDSIPRLVLNQVDFFYSLKDMDPSHLFLQALFQRSRANAIITTVDSVEFRSSNHIFEVLWYNDHPDQWSIYMGRTHNGGKLITNGMQQIRAYFNGKGTKLLVWHDTVKPNGAEVSIYDYCEVYNPETGLTWYGQPGIEESAISVMPKSFDLMPKKHSFGVWK